MKPSLLIWDWNGTLLDDVSLCNRCLNDLLAGHGYTQRYDAAAYKEIFGFPIQDYYVRAGFDFSRHPYEELAEIYMAQYLPAAEGCGLCPGACEALEWAKDAGIRQVILSASQLPILRRQVEERSLSGFFDELLGQSDIYARGKKETGLSYLKESGIDPASAVLVGDTLHDLEVAQAMCTRCVLCAAGHQSRARLEAAGVPVIGTLNELPACLEQL
ncbi:HAD family hydrolase [Allofournierella massiliensis]|uniref:HAD hydrolase-like protein n=1 Tax=Allofournierella massiliensis TaxID=1650663 RepID=A0ABT7ULR6_9FIRM|nr:HAD hydrolase-like protein [Fournierella massiliensis]MDM8199841.1 HAD hydrolase-like protein [Fournierella massiliensis]